MKHIYIAKAERFNSVFICFFFSNALPDLVCFFFSLILSFNFHVELLLLLLLLLLIIIISLFLVAEIVKNNEEFGYSVL